MPIFDVATGKMDKPSCNLEPPYIWLMDRSDRLGSALPLGKKNVAISVVDNKIVVGKPWGKEILPYDDAKQTGCVSFLFQGQIAQYMNGQSSLGSEGPGLHMFSYPGPPGAIIQD